MSPPDRAETGASSSPAPPAAWRPFVAVGVGVTSFLLATVAVTELASSAVEFSLLLGLPAGLLAGLAGTLLTYSRLGGDASRIVRAGAAGTAAFGYTVAALWAVRYAAAGTRSLLDVSTVVSAAVATAVVVATLRMRAA